MQRFSDVTHPLAKSVARIRGVLWAVFRPFFDFVPFLAVLLFFGALFWAKAQDPFARKWFTVKTAERGSVKCVAVLPKPIRPCPVVIYAHGWHGSLMIDGNDLRQMAELGVAVLSLEYDQTNESAFAGQFEAVLHYLGREKWANTNAVAWVGFSLGANRMLDFAVQHPGLQPQLIVQLSGAGVRQSLFAPQILTNLHCPVLLIHGEQDQTFPLADTKALASVLHSNGVPFELKVIPGASHGMELEGGVVFRCIGEYCLTHSEGKDAWRHYHSITQWQSEAPALWLFWLPAVAWSVGRFVWCRSRRYAPPDHIKLKRHEIALRWVAAILATCALGVMAVHLLSPHFLVSERTLSIARKHLVELKQTADFECLAARPIWNGQKLKTLLDHVELASYNRKLINWQLDDKIYRDYVLSSEITGQPGEQLNWRRPLWEEFYPRIRHEPSPEEASKIVVRHLRERVTIASMPDLPRELPAIWLRQITDETGFETIYVAALRSVGVPARLDSRQRTEYWDGAKWASAPQPLVLSW
jgi:pimeloyl-ACP methyl ester carboxylesterase